ncbi:MAG: cytochrome c/FTR1 family iron permease [Thermodesulfobacteriota bacterium]
MPMLKKVLTFSILLCSLLFLLAKPSYSSNDANRILSLVDYIGGDYVNAVKDGRVINTAEYNEMLEFSSGVEALFLTMKSEGGDKAGIESDLDILSGLIKNKAPAGEVESLSKTIKGKIIEAYDIVPHPGEAPSYASGKDIFESTCAQCHGAHGAGDGPLAPGLDPAPANFTNPEVSLGLSPFKVYNTMTFGIEGTGMPSFPGLSDQEKWDAAFYVLALGYNEKDVAEGSKLASKLPDGIKDYKALATLSNGEINDRLGSLLNNSDEETAALAYLREGVMEKAVGEGSPLLTAGSLLDESTKLYKDGRTDEAYTKALDAYLEGFEQAEAQLRVRDEKLTAAIEAEFADFRNSIKAGKPAARVEELNTKIQASLLAAQGVLDNGKQSSNILSFLNSFSIIVREGLEAILIIAAIIAFMGATGAKKQIKYVHYGWILALAAGILTWLLARTVISISGAQREVIEGVTSLVAAAVLFYVSYWLISKIEVRVWKQYIQGKVEKALSKGSVIALASVSFFAVYREAFETVLFYQALWFQSEKSQAAILWGLVAGALLLIVLFYVIFKLALRIPLKYLFSVTSMFLYLLSFILLGKGINELQEAGIVGATPAGFIPHIDILGLYPTLETALPQALLLAAFVFALVWLEYVKREREKNEIAVSVARIAEDMKSMHSAFDHIKGHIIEWRKCEDIDLEAEDLDRRIQDVISHVDELESKVGDFYTVVTKNNQPVKPH